MPTPRIPTGFKPIIQGYQIGKPEGVVMTEVVGGLPRSALQWDRGVQPFTITMIIERDKYSIWNLFFIHTIKKGSIQFFLPLDSTAELQDHLCMMVTDSYSAARAGGQVWSVSFTVLAENAAYDVSAEDAAAILESWELLGEDMNALLARIAQFANTDVLALGTP